MPSDEIQGAGTRHVRGKSGKSTKKTIDEFLKAVYPYMTDLRVTMARNEDTLLRDATQEIGRLKRIEKAAIDISLWITEENNGTEVSIMRPDGKKWQTEDFASVVRNLHEAISTGEG